MTSHSPPRPGAAPQVLQGCFPGCPQRRPDTMDGRRLLAHELTHVIQQRRGQVRGPRAAGLALVQDPALEAEAERNAGRAAVQRGTAAGAAPAEAIFGDYTVRSQSPFKTIGKLSHPRYGDSAIAVARTAAFDGRLERELRHLQEIGASPCAPRVVPLYCAEPLRVPSPGDRSHTSRSAAYLMKWIDGFHSKTDRARFDNTLATLRETRKQTALADLNGLDRYLTTQKTIPDLQVMLEPASGRLYLLDPGERGLTPAKSRRHPYVEKWLGLLTGEHKPGHTGAFDRQAVD